MITKITISLITIFLSLTSLISQETNYESFVHDGIARNYIVYVPAIYDETVPTPLMFNFHGYTGNATGLMGITGMREVADTAGFIIVYPQGSLLFGLTHWNVGAWTDGSTADDIGFTDAMIDTIAANYNINLNRVYSSGFSNGGYFSFELACQLSNRIAAIGSVGGKMSSETFNFCSPSHPTPVITIHGTDDDVVSYYGSQPSNSKTISEVNNYWANYNNTDTSPTIEDIPNTNTFDGSTVEYHSYSNGNNCTSVAHYKVIGGGHDWPGAWGNQDIDASEVIWNFVSQYDINGLIDCNLTSITEAVEESDEIIIYPNPTKDLVSIKMDLTENMECQIYSMNGQLILSKTINSKNNTIDVSNLHPNIYVLNIGSQFIKLVKTK